MKKIIYSLSVAVLAMGLVLGSAGCANSCNACGTKPSACAKKTCCPKSCTCDKCGTKECPCPKAGTKACPCPKAKKCGEKNACKPCDKKAACEKK